ncbi:MAG TPA: ABC transporter ATP-binding protein [Pirellulaceae bacterium]|jgi:ABC-2 type transport system ATP-binding protein|nr:ABC transporter ATP-binding protein [Pirellulaceae bacterium]
MSAVAMPSAQLVDDSADAGYAVAVRDLHKTYRDGVLSRKSFTALKGITFSVMPGEIFGLLGPNGAGKTTCVKVLLGIVRKSGGAASVFGAPAGSRQARMRIGYLPENLRIRKYHDAWSALEYYGQLSGLSLRTIRERREGLLASVGLLERASDPASKYSKGMLQRLGLAQALLHDPDLLVLDEPTDGLDPVVRNQIRVLLEDLSKRGKTIFLNSHILQEVELICDRVAILDRGEVKFVGPVKELTRQRETVAQVGGQVAGQPASHSAVPPRAELEVTLELEGSPDAILAALPREQVVRSDTLRGGVVSVVARFADQTDLNRTLTALIGSGVVIHGFQRKRASLEEAFLRLVGPTSNE